LKDFGRPPETPRNTIVPTLNQLVLGSSPSRGTRIPEENNESGKFDTIPGQISNKSESNTARFPKVIRHRKTEATIYGKSAGYSLYRVAYRVDGKRRMKSFAVYAEAKTWADKTVRDVSTGSKLVSLTAGKRATPWPPLIAYRGSTSPPGAASPSRKPYQSFVKWWAN
jgi:hypothetical protein